MKQQLNEVRRIDPGPENWARVEGVRSARPLHRIRPTTRILRSVLSFVVALLAIGALATWLAGVSSYGVISAFIIGILTLASIYFLLTLLMRLPFIGLNTSLASLLSIFTVLIGLLALLPKLHALQATQSVSPELTITLAVLALILAVYLLTSRR